MKKGKILKIKSGYNPNSSSIGTDISIFIRSAFASVVILNTIMPTLARLFKKKKK